MAQVKDEVVIDETVLDAIAEKMNSKVDSQVNKAMEEFRGEIAKAAKEASESKEKTVKFDLTENEKKDFSVDYFKAMGRGDVRKMNDLYNQVEKASNTLMEDNSSGSGMISIVPTPIREGIIQWAYKYGVFRRYAQVFPMTSETLGIPRMDSDAAFSIIAEGTSYANLNFQASSVTAAAKKAGGIVTATRELLADANTSVVDFLYERFGIAAAKFEDIQGFTGSGTGSNFLGILNDTNAQTYSLGGSTTSGKTHVSDVTYDDMLKIAASLEDGVDEGSAFFMHKSVLLSGLMSQKASTAGTYLANNPGQGGNLMNIWGRPVVTSPVLPQYSTAVAASTPFMVYGNLRNYILGDRQMMEVQILNERYAELGKIGVAVSERIAIVGALPQFVVKGTTSAS